MPTKHQFIKDIGIKFTKSGNSFILSMISVGEKLTQDQLGSLAKITRNYLDALSGRDAIIDSEDPAEYPDFDSRADNILIKYVTNESLLHIKNGTLQLGSTQYYRDISRIESQDQHEGYGLLHIPVEERMLHCSGTAGFNTYIFCGSRRDVDDRLMRQKFGPNRITITNPIRFFDFINRKISGKKFSIRDIQYGDKKNYIVSKNKIILTEPFIHPRESIRAGELQSFVHSNFQELQTLFMLPAILTKPARYSSEKERRVLFDMNKDLDKPTIIVDIKQISRYLRID